jgi:hypothetical protein
MQRLPALLAARFTRVVGREIAAPSHQRTLRALRLRTIAGMAPAFRMLAPGLVATVHNPSLSILPQIPIPDPISRHRLEGLLMMAAWRETLEVGHKVPKWPQSHAATPARIVSISLAREPQRNTSRCCISSPLPPGPMRLC